MGLYNWRNKLLGDWPMRAGDHDPVNGWSVNRGRAGADLDAAFGAGAATPTKLGYRRGYSFGNDDYMQCSAGYTLTSGLISVMVTFGGLDPTVADYLFDWETVVAGERIAGLYCSGAGEIRFFCGSTAAVANMARITIANYALAQGQVQTVIGVYDGTDQLAYANGEFVATAVTPVAPHGGSHPMTIGCRSSLANYLTGNIYHVGMADFALSPSQCKMYDRLMRQQFHQI